MDLSFYLAITGAELRGAFNAEQSLAWMACRFSSSGTGISGIPTSLPPRSMLMLTDEIPVQDHDPTRVAAELTQAAQELDCSCILLDFQRPDYSKTSDIANAIVKASSIPVGISSLYAKQFDCPVLVSPSPIWLPLAQQLAPWKGREIWLEAILEDALVTVTETGSQYEPCSDTGNYPFYDDELCVSYKTDAVGSALRFYLHRGRDELTKLLEKAKTYGIKSVVGLYQQLGI